MSTMMKCGHAAQGTSNGKPACVTCIGLHPGADEVDENPPTMKGRIAKCSCGRTSPSSASLPFFEYLGPGSPKLAVTCGHCAFYIQAHSPEVMAKNASLKCTDFVAHAPYEFDRYYCGCRGWD